MTENHPVMPPQFNTLTLKEAKKRTRHWRKAIKPLYGNNPHKMPHGFFLHMDDIRELCNLHKYMHQEIEGVRVYFSFDKEQEPDEHKHYPDTIRGILVPVYLATAVESKEPMLMDLIVSVNSKHKGDDPEGDVSVFDVSQPCPPMCDATSPLFKDTP